MSKKIEVKKDLEDVSTAVAEINKTQAGIAELRKKYDKVIFEVDTSEGMDEARAARREVREPRFSIEHLRKDAKAPVLELGRTIDAMAAELTTEILAIEEPIDAQIKAEEQRISDEKEAVIAAEKQRVDDIRARITALSDGVDTIVNSKRKSDNIAKCITAYRNKPVDESFEELQETAEEIWQTGLKRLEEHLAAVADRETEAAKIELEREELARLREADEKRRQEEADAAAEAERQRQEKEAEERRDLEEQRKRQEDAQVLIDAENKRIADEQAALEQQKRDEEARKQAEENAEMARKIAEDEAAKRAIYPGDQAVVNALCAHFGVPGKVAQNWIKQLKGEKK